MKARLLVTMLLVAGAVACGDATESGTTSGGGGESAAERYLDGSDTATLDDCRTEAMARVRRLKDHPPLRVVATPIVSFLEATDAAVDGARTLVDEKVPVPLQTAHDVSSRLERRVRMLQGTVVALDQSASDLDGAVREDVIAAAKAVARLSHKLGGFREGFVEAVIHEVNPANLKESDVAMRGGTDVRGRFDAARLYHGDPSWCEKAAVVDVNAVYRKIPEYRELKEKGIKEDGPRYYFLLIEAGKKFGMALRKVASRDGYDVIGGLGAIEIPGQDVPEVTEEVIAALP